MSTVASLLRNVRVCRQSIAVDRFLCDLYGIAADPLPKTEHVVGIDEHIIANPEERPK